MHTAPRDLASVFHRCRGQPGRLPAPLAPLQRPAMTSTRPIRGTVLPGLEGIKPGGCSSGTGGCHCSEYLPKGYPSGWKTDDDRRRSGSGGTRGVKGLQPVTASGGARQPKHHREALETVRREGRTSWVGLEIVEGRPQSLAAPPRTMDRSRGEGQGHWLAWEELTKARIVARPGHPSASPPSAPPQWAGVETGRRRGCAPPARVVSLPRNATVPVSLGRRGGRGSPPRGQSAHSPHENGVGVVPVERQSSGAKAEKASHATETSPARGLAFRPPPESARGRFGR